MARTAWCGSRASQALFSFLRFFANPLVIILLVASGISLVLGDPVGGLIIIAMVLLSVLLNFFMEFQARHAVEEIRKQVATTAAVLRDGQEQELPVAELVPGDIVRLNAGDLVPADARLLDVKDLHVRESALTGESLPVEKAARRSSRGEARRCRREQQRVPGHCGSDGDWHRGHRLHRQRHRSRRDCPAAGDAAAGDRVRPWHTPLRADDHPGDHAARAFRPAGKHRSSTARCWSPSSSQSRWQ